MLFLVGSNTLKTSPEGAVDPKKITDTPGLNCTKSKIYLTLPETNMAPENGWLEDVFPIEMIPFQVRTVSFREGTLPRKVFIFFRLAMHLLSMYSEGGQKMQVEPEVVTDGQMGVSGVKGSQKVMICMSWVVPPPRMPVTNEGLGWDPRS